MTRKIHDLCSKARWSSKALPIVSRIDAQTRFSQNGKGTFRMPAVFRLRIARAALWTSSCLQRRQSLASDRMQGG